MEGMIIDNQFSVIHSENRNKFILPETLEIRDLQERNPLPRQKVDFSAVKNVTFDSCSSEGSQRDIKNDFIQHVLQSCENI